MVGWLTLSTLSLKSLPVVPEEAIGQVKEPVPPAPIGVLAIIVPTSVPAFTKTSFTAEPGLPVYVEVTVRLGPLFQVSPPFGAITVIEGAVVPALCG